MVRPDVLFAVIVLDGFLFTGAFRLRPCITIIRGECPDHLISFYLYTSLNSRTGELVSIGGAKDNLSASHYSPMFPSKVIIHGYNADSFQQSLVDIKNEYLKSGSYNVWMVDWGKLCAGPCYLAAAWNIRHVGQCTAQLIARLRQLTKSAQLDIHIIGFSLGAHLAAYTAIHLRPYKLPRITGLDPALPLFITDIGERRLDATDAVFVDVMHTNALIQGQYRTCGHVDFYVNGGINQPGCWQNEKQSVDNPFTCDHVRATHYFTESIRSQQGFWGWPCDSLSDYLMGHCREPHAEPQLMGEHTNNTARGVYLVPTAAESPFALGPWVKAVTKPM